VTEMSLNLIMDNCFVAASVGLSGVGVPEFNTNKSPALAIRLERRKKGGSCDDKDSMQN